jgi:hypothetical protein
MREIALLGPQRPEFYVNKALDRLGVRSAVATVTCGWQEHEDELDELRSHLGRPVIPLLLHRRSDELFQEDPELFAAYRKRQDRLRQIQALYRLRLGYALDAARELLQREGSMELLEPEREAALQALRTLDREHLTRMREVHARFESEWRPDEREALQRHRRELATELDEASALVLAGGHVAVLLNRLRLFDVLSMVEEKPLVAWSAGAMALSASIVLFHDRPPYGRGNPEVLEAGLEITPEIVPFPDARRRLRLKDRVRVALLARRFDPRPCVALDPGAELYCKDGHWSAGEHARRLGPSGELTEFPE